MSATIVPFGPPPRAFQTRGAQRIEKNGAAFLMWDMGKGKTRACIMAAKRIGIPVLVLAPINAATITWPDELTKWAPDMTYCVLHGPNKEHLASRAHLYDVTIINFDGLIWFYKMVEQRILKLRKFFVIWDESSLLKDSTTKRWKIMAEAMPIYSPYRVCLSGTPMPTHMVDLWAQYYLLDGGKRLSPSFYSYRNTYFDYSGPPKYKTTIKEGAAPLIYNRIADITDRLGPEDELSLPDVMYNDILLEMPPNVRRQYEELETEFLLEFGDGDVIANSSAVLTSKLRQFSQGAVYLERDPGVPRGTPKEYRVVHDIKAKAVKSIVETANGNPILAPIQFRFEKAMIDKELKYDVPIISGSTSAGQMRQLVSRWNEGGIPLLLVHPRSVAMSLNLQFGGHTILWVALPWEMDLYEQLIRRLRRPGQKNKVVINRLMFKNSIDIIVAEAVKRKFWQQEDLFEGIKQRKGRGGI